MSEKTILLVEDNPSDIALTRRAFTKNKITSPLIVMDDGQKALDYLFGSGEHEDRDSAAVPTLILLDLNLPKIDGLTVLKHIRADPRTRRVPVVILTSSTEVQDMSTGYDRGVNSYLRKPVNFDQFVAAIGQVTAYWLFLNEEPPRMNLD